LTKGAIGRVATPRRRSEARAAIGIDTHHAAASAADARALTRRSPPPKKPAIVGTDLTKWFGEGSSKTTAVDRVGLTAYFGEMLFIVGPSGSGKTTLLSMISGILRPNAGKVVGQRRRHLEVE
jgi:ABC-type glutathione transport system ATPase component